MEALDVLSRKGDDMVKDFLPAHTSMGRPFAAEIWTGFGGSGFSGAGFWRSGFFSLTVAFFFFVAARFVLAIDQVPMILGELLCIGCIVQLLPLCRPHEGDKSTPQLLRLSLYITFPLLEGGGGGKSKFFLSLLNAELKYSPNSFNIAQDFVVSKS